MSKLSSLNALYLATIPITGIYLIPGGIPLSLCLFPFLFVANFLSNRLDYIITRRKNEVFWFLSITTIGFIGMVGALFNAQMYFDTTLFIHNYFNIFIFFLSLIFFTNKSNIQVFIKTIVIIGIIAASICIFQRVQLLLTGSFYKDFFIPGLETDRSIDTFSVDRPSSIFTEPAHLSIFLLPISYILLCRKSYMIFAITALGILFSGSTTGFLLLLLLALIFMMTSNVRKIYIVLLAVLGCVIFILIMIYFPDVLIGNVEKLNNTSTGSVRLLGPLQYISLFDITQWMFGIGLNQLTDFLRIHNITIVDEWGIVKNANYANAVIYMLISYGICGLTCSIKYFTRSIKKYCCDKGFIIYIFGILFSDQVLFNRNLLFILCFMIFSRDIKSYIETDNNPQYS